eukprot:6163214-Amphidinium_carterae.1
MKALLRGCHNRKMTSGSLRARGLWSSLGRATGSQRLQQFVEIISVCEAMASQQTNPKTYSCDKTVITMKEYIQKPVSPLLRTDLNSLSPKLSIAFSLPFCVANAQSA